MITKVLSGPKKKGAFGNIRPFISNRTDFLERLWRKYGDYCHFRLGILDVILINDPALIMHVLMDDAKFPKSSAMRFAKKIIGNGILTSSGSFHRRQRRMMAPAFRPKSLPKYLSGMIGAIDDTVVNWKEDTSIDFYEQMCGLALKVVSNTLFGTDTDTKIQLRVSNAMNTVMSAGDRVAEPTGALKMLLPLPSTLAFHRARKELDIIIYDLIREHRESPDKYDDLLTILLGAQDEDDGIRMTDKQVRDEALTLYLAGHETTAVCLTWTYYALAQHQEIRSQLHHEIDSKLQGRKPTIDDLGKLVYTRRVLMESMRLYPPVAFTDRQPVDDWDTEGFTIPKKTFVFLCPYTMHRHPDYYDEPLRFNPERWTTQFIQGLPKGAYIPFGAGPHVCIGEHFAWTELMLAIVTISQNWTVDLVPDQEIRTKPLITLRPEGSIQVYLKRRN